MSIFGSIGSAIGGAWDSAFGSHVTTPNAPTYDWSKETDYENQQNDSRGQQNALASQLQQQANGNGPSVAAHQMRLGQNAAMQQTNAQAASAGGGSLNRMLAQKGAIDANAQTNQQIAGQAGMAKAQEQLNAQGALGNLLGQTRQQDIGMAQLQSNDVLGVGSNINQANGIQAAAQEGQDSNRSNMLGAIGGAGAGVGSIAMMSDKRLKTDIRRSSNSDLDDLLRDLQPTDYTYKDGSGDRTGIIAQDAEKSPIGQKMIRHVGPENMRYIDTNSALSVVLAELGRIGQRLDERDGK